MSSGVRGNGPDCVELYQASLEQRLQQGHSDLVCRDEELCKEIEARLSKSNAQDIHAQLGLDTLSVIEASLRASPTTTGQTRLGYLSKAFEVLELAALNLYLCPWRKEYRVVKTFSGMFTHCVKPALTSQQARELFGLLGYQPGGFGEEEELRLNSKPAHGAVLLPLVCAFFAARVECQLLLPAVAQLGGRVEQELQLIQERKRGHSLQAALESTRRKLASAPTSLNNNVTDTDVDLYTDNTLAESNRMTSPPSCSYIPPSESVLSRTKSHSSTSQSKREPSGMFEKEKYVTAVGTDQVSGSTVGPLCSSLNESGPCPLECFTTGNEHGRDFRMEAQSQTTQAHIPSWERAPKDSLKQHFCMKNPTRDYFCVCHDCPVIHDVTCVDLGTCEVQGHNVQITGRLQPPQQARVTAPPERHDCLKMDDLSFVLCDTCNQFHDLLCSAKERCQMSGHDVKYVIESNKEETPTPSLPMSFHNCCTSAPPDFVCLTCRVFHGTTCSDSQCETHELCHLNSLCSECSCSDIFQLCRYCFSRYCKPCWFKSPLDCKCGKPFQNSSAV